MADIIIGDEQPRRVYAVGSTLESEFAVPFPFLADTDVHVVVNAGQSDEELNIGADYTVTGAGGQSGTVTLTNPVRNCTVTVYRELVIERSTRFPGAGTLKIPALNREFDRVVMMLQQQLDKLKRSISLAASDDLGTNATLPVAQQRAGRLFVFDTAGRPVMSDATVAQIEGATLGSYLDGQSVGDVTGYVGDGVTVRFPTGHNLISKSSVTVVIGGVKQAPESYSIDGQDVVLVAAPPDGVKVDIRVIGVNVALADASGSQVIVPYSELPRAIADWFSDVVTPRAFDGVLDGVTDDTAALVAAVAAAGTAKAIVIDGPLYLASPQSVSIPAGAALEFRGTGRLIWNFGALQSVTVEDPGRGYSSIPAVTVSGSGALGTVTMETDTVEQLVPIYSATGAAVVAGGTGYAVGDLIRPAGGSYTNMGQAVFAVASVTGGAVTGLTVVGPGGGYLQAPSGTLTTTALSGSGSGCTVTMAVSNRTVAGAADGSGYTVGDTLSVAGNGTPATLTVTSVYGSGSVGGLVVATPGAYVEPPGWDTTYANTDFHLFRAPTGGTGSGCQVYTTTTAMDAGIANAGTGYSVGDTLTVAGGTGTAATFRVDAVSSTGAILTLHATNRGAYTALPSSPATVTGGAGTGASLHLLWRVKSVAVATAGAYTTTPTITVSGGGTPRWPARFTPVGRKPTLSCTIQAASREIFSGYRRFDGGLSPSRADVRWFGAQGDLSTDDTDAIQAAIDSVIHVDFLPGGYVCAGMLFGRSFRKLRGSGRTPADGGYAQFGTNLLFTGSARAGLDSDLGRDIAGFEMSDMTLSCNGLSARTHTLRLNNPRNCVLRNVEAGASPNGNAVVLHGTGLHAYSFDQSSYPCWINKVVDCVFGAVSGWSLVVDGITDSRFIGNYLSGGKGVVEYGANNQWGLSMSDNASKSMFFVVQRSLMQYAKYTTLVGTSFQQQVGSANTAITVQGMDFNKPIDAYVSITGNTFNNCPANAHVYFQNAKRMTFVGNNFDPSAPHFASGGNYDNYVVADNILPRVVPGATSGAAVANNIR